MIESACLALRIGAKVLQVDIGGTSVKDHIAVRAAHACSLGLGTAGDNLHFADRACLARHSAIVGDAFEFANRALSACHVAVVGIADHVAFGACGTAAGGAMARCVAKGSLSAACQGALVVETFEVAICACRAFAAAVAAL